MFTQNLKTISEAEKAEMKFHPLFTILFLFLILFVSYIPIGIIMIAPLLSQGLDPSEFGPEEYWWGNALLLIPILFYVAYCVWIERRSPRSMGFSRGNIFIQYLQGSGIGLLLIVSALLICYASGTMSYQGMVLSTSWFVILLWLLGFIVQGMEEEVIFRGFLMISLSNRMPMIWAIVINSILFSLMHFFNTGFDILPMINLFLFGLFVSLYFLRTDNIWGIAAIHSVWNWSQGNLFGISVSGIGVENTVWKFVPNPEYKIINGGDFGLEGGLAITFVLCAAILITGLSLRKKSVLEKQTLLQYPEQSPN